MTWRHAFRPWAWPSLAWPPLGLPLPPLAPLWPPLTSPWPSLGAPWASHGLPLASLDILSASPWAFLSVPWPPLGLSWPPPGAFCPHFGSSRRAWRPCSLPLAAFGVSHWRSSAFSWLPLKARSRGLSLIPEHFLNLPLGCPGIPRQNLEGRDSTLKQI